MDTGTASKSNDLYDKWYIFYPLNILLLVFFSAVLLHSGNPIPDEWFLQVILHPYFAGVMVAISGLSILVRLTTALWKYNVAKSLILFTILIALIIGIVKVILLLPTSLAIVIGALLIAIAIYSK